LKKDGAVVSTTTLTYDCQSLAGTECVPTKQSLSTSLFDGLTNIYTLGGLLLFFIILLAFLRVRGKKRSEGEANEIEYTKPSEF
jgi:L-asparagine transporter-like permease